MPSAVCWENSTSHEIKWTETLRTGVILNHALWGQLPEYDSYMERVNVAPDECQEQLFPVVSHTAMTT